MCCGRPLARSLSVSLLVNVQMTLTTQVMDDSCENALAKLLRINSVDRAKAILSLERQKSLYWSVGQT